MIDFDYNLFHLINSRWSNGFFDWLMPILRNKYMWAPFYAALVAFLIINFKKSGLAIVVGLLLTVTLCDQLSSNVVKPFVKRPRPCHQWQSPMQMTLRVDCGPGKSFTSSHATNHFGIASFLVFLFGFRRKWIGAGLLFWAAAISYAQVYVGVHFPLDVFGGALLGAAIGVTVGWLIRFVLSKIPENQSP